MTQYKYLCGSQDSREAVEFDITQRHQYIRMRFAKKRESNMNLSVLIAEIR